MSSSTIRVLTRRSIVPRPSGYLRPQHRTLYMMPLVDNNNNNSPVEATPPESSRQASQRHSDTTSSTTTSSSESKLNSNHNSSTTPSKSTINQNKAHPTPSSSPRGTKSQSAIRHFSTTPSSNAIHDQSTIDFAFFPTNSNNMELDSHPTSSSIRVPLLPDVPTSPSSSVIQPPESPDEVVFRGEINTIAHESTFQHPPSAMSDVVDNAAMMIDPFDLSTSVEKAARKINGGGAGGGLDEDGGKGGKRGGVFREVWDGLIEDLFGDGGSKLKPA